MNVFLFELKAYRKSTAIWVVSLLALIVLFLSMFPSFAKDVEDFQKLLESYPEAVRKAFGIEGDQFFSILGFYSYVFVYVALCGAIQAMNVGISIVSKEMREKAADFLMAKPISRTNILTAKLLAALTSFIITNVIFIPAALVVATLVKAEDFSVKIFLLLSIRLFFIQIIFLALGTFMAIVLPKVKSVLALSISTVFAFFIIGMLGSATDDEALRFLSPFQYFDSKYIMENISYEPAFMMTGFALIIILLVLSLIIYRKKDIHAV